MCTPKAVPDPAPDWVQPSKTVPELRAQVAQLRLACTDALEYLNTGSEQCGRWSVGYLKLRQTLLDALIQTK